METDPNDHMEQIARQDGRYAYEAYQFLQNGLEFTSRRFHGERTPDGGPYHVTGKQLCEGLRDLAIRCWGPLALDILKQWNVTCTRDFGEMVFLMVEHEQMGKRDSDAVEDFDDVYDFNEVFADYKIDLDRKRAEGEDAD